MAILLRMEQPPRPALDRQAWIRQATDCLAESGVDGIRVETLAKRLGVTKGSFYWHFKDRPALLEAVLDAWQTGRVREASRLVEQAADPGEQILHVMKLHSLEPNQKGIAIELAIRDWARRDGRAMAAVESVDQARLSEASRLFERAGFKTAEARARALLLYTHAFGMSLMFFQSNSEDITALHKRISELIVGL